MKIHDFLNMSPPSVETGASTAFIEAVVAQRSIKSELEIEQIGEAIEITGAMQTLAMKTAKPGMIEREVVGAAR